MQPGVINKQSSGSPRRGARRYGTDKQRWRAVVSREREADGQFFFSVKTTGIYCRPSCPARRARRENVAFHRSWADAERAGFRPCKRCQPNGAGQEERYAATVARACRILQTAEEPPSLAALARQMGMSAFHFHRIFKSRVGLTPKAYTRARRAERLRDTLPRRRTVTEAMYAAGYQSSSRFYAEAKERLGMAPRSFRKGGVGIPIRFAVGECSLGSVLVASSDAGVCAILLGDNPDALVKDLQDRFAGATLLGGDGEFERVVARVIGLIERPGQIVELPLDIRGTAFQQQVWQALREIPPGQTVSYTDIAARLKRPRAVRAVAQACGANALAVAIPCHRVVRRDGRLSGYRWGVERKRALLRREGSKNRA